MNTSLFFLATVVISQASCFAQVTRPSFEVASIKLSKTDEPWFWNITAGGRMIAHNATLQTLLMLAYRLQDFQIVGGPGWVSKDQFDIEAKPNDADPTDEQSRQMLQVLLEERFQLSAHMEMRDGPVFILVTVKNGPPRSVDQAPPTPQTGSSPVRGSSRPRGAMQMRSGLADGIAVPISLLTRFLSQTVGRPVIDQTDLEGRYDIHLKWLPDMVTQNSQATPSPQIDGPSLFTALQEQIGLKLISATRPINKLVIEKLERLAEN